MGIWECVGLHHGIVRTADHPSLRNAWSRAIKNGRLLRALPGVVMDAGLQQDHGAWMRAVCLWDPNAVIAGRAAAQALFAPDAALTTIPVYAPTNLKDRGPLRFRRRAIRSDFLAWNHGLRITGVEATALTAALEGDFEPGTEALRNRLVKPEDIEYVAANWCRKVPKAVRVAGADFGRNPWSVAEVEAHRLLVANGITGWVANPQLWLGDMLLTPDILFRRSKTIFEINSFAHHSSREQMERDSVRFNQFTRHGYGAYILTPQQIRLHPEETAEFVKSVVWQREQGRIADRRIEGNGYL